MTLSWIQGNTLERCALPIPSKDFPAGFKMYLVKRQSKPRDTSKDSDQRKENQKHEYSGFGTSNSLNLKCEWRVNPSHVNDYFRDQRKL